MENQAENLNSVEVVEDFCQDSIPSDENPEETQTINDNSVSSFDQHKDCVYKVSINKHHQDIFCSSSKDETCFLWRLNNEEKEPLKIQDFGDSVVCSGFNPNGSLVYGGALNGIIKVYDVFNGKHLATFEGPEDLTFVEWHTEGNIIICGGSGGVVNMYNVDKNAFMSCYGGHEGTVNVGMFTKDGKNIISGDSYGKTLLFDPVSRNVLQTFTTRRYQNSENSVISMSLHSNNNLAVIGSSNHEAYLLNIRNGQTIKTFKGHEDSVESAIFVENQNIVVTGSLDTKIMLWDVNTGQSYNNYSHSDGIVKMINVENTPLIYSGSLDGTIKLWDVRVSECVHSFEGHTGEIYDFDLSPDGKTVVSASEDGRCLVFQR